MTAFETTDELYTCLDGKPSITVLATATSKVDKKPYPMAFVLDAAKGASSTPRSVTTSSAEHARSRRTPPPRHRLDGRAEPDRDAVAAVVGRGRVLRDPRGLCYEQITISRRRDERACVESSL